jgi:hypothetical protein
LSDTFRESIAKRFSALAHRAISLLRTNHFALGGKADINWLALPVRSVENDPTATSAANPAVMHNVQPMW